MGYRYIGSNGIISLYSVTTFMNTPSDYVSLKELVNILNKIFALFKSKEYFDKKVTIKGWYRRSPVPYVEIYKMEIDGKTKKIYTYIINKIIYYILLAICVVIFCGLM